MSLPESITDRIKKVLFKVLDLPEEGLEYAQVHVGHFVHDIVIKVKTELAEDKKEIIELKDWLFNNDRFSADAIHENSSTHEFIMTPPENIKPELEQISKIQKAEDGVVNKEDSINKLLDTIENKTA